MYTHFCGYKFRVIINPNGAGGVVNEALLSNLYAMQGEYNDQLTWPAKATFTLELINVKGRANLRAEHIVTWNKPVGAMNRMQRLHRTNHKGYLVFLPLSDIGDFLHNDSLQFIINVH